MRLEEQAPRLYALPPGADFPAALLAGLEDRLAGEPPEAWARVTLFVNTGRMQRRLRTLFDAGPARLLPRIRLVSDLAGEAGFPEVPAALSPLALKLELAGLVAGLVAAHPDLAPRAAVFDLAGSLAALMDEMAGEGVEAEALAALDVGQHAAHWQRARAVVEAAATHFAGAGRPLPGAEARRRRIVAALAARWAEAPPEGPVIVAGSTGSRGTTRALMEAVARLPQGAVVLPGYDGTMDEETWGELDAALTAEDHPQFRFRALMGGLGLGPGQIRPWHPAGPPVPERNRLISLALRPAPVTDRWRSEGARLTGLARAAEGLSLLEAPSPRAEAAALALRLRQAVEEGARAALVTPDRGLTRQVAAALDRWGIVPDDSAGVPLHLSAPGRLLRETAALMARAPDLPGLVALLSHPLAASGDARGPHLLLARGLELHLREAAAAQPGPEHLAAWAQKEPERRGAWAGWLAGLLAPLPLSGAWPLAELAARHRALAEALAGGPGGGPGALWKEAAGEAARTAMEALAAAADAAPEMTAEDYGRLLEGHLSEAAVQDPRLSHPDVMIWGTQEARVGGADLVLLAGLNDGTWPDLAPPDPWLNRQMRHAAGLLLPDRRIGLAAHDFQIAVAAPVVVLSRAIRDAEAETVPSRWLNRLSNLLDGLGPEGRAALAGMRGRGAALLAQAARLERPGAPVAAAPRPSPRPPLKARPGRLAVTSITRLIRDPYAIYARHVLHLRRLAPLRPEPDARLRGTVLHRIMDDFVDAWPEWHGEREAGRTVLARIARARLAEATPGAAMRALWLARLMAAADRLIEGEAARRAVGAPVLSEDWGEASVADLPFRLSARPDRIDRLIEGGHAIHDYKSGTPPSLKQVRLFDKQLPLEAALLERGGFPGLAAGPVAAMSYIALGANGKDVPIPVEEEDGRMPDLAWQGLIALLCRYGRREQGYTAQRAAEKVSFAGDYDHLARFGEWQLTDPPVGETVGPPDEDGEPGP